MKQTVRFPKKYSKHVMPTKTPNNNKQPCCVRHPWETCSFTSFSASVSSLNHQIFTYFVQRRSFLSSCYHLNLKQAFKVNNLVLWLCTTVAVTGRVLFVKWAVAHAHAKKTPVYFLSSEFFMDVVSRTVFLSPFVLKDIFKLLWMAINNC